MPYVTVHIKRTRTITEESTVRINMSSEDDLALSDAIDTFALEDDLADGVSDIEVLNSWEVIDDVIPIAEINFVKLEVQE